MAVAVNLQRDAGVMLSNLQILFDMPMNRMSFSIMALGLSRSFVSESGDRCLGSSTTRSLGGIIYVSDGVVAPSEQSKHSWTSASLVMSLLYELQILFSGGPAASGVNVVIAETCAFSIILTLIRTS